MSTYRDTITNAVSKFSNTDENWVAFVKDHYSYLMMTSSTNIISNNNRVTYRFRLREYLKEIANLDPETYWIIMWLNNFDQEYDFNDATNLIIPNQTNLNYLYSTYLTISRNLTTKTGLDSWQ